MSITITSDFPEKWDEFIRETDERIGRVLKGIGQDLRRNVARRTPILTGRAAGSWNANLNTPNNTPQPEGYDNPGAPWDDGKEDLDGAKARDKVIVSNGLDYIRSLNEGSSVKAPAGFVELATMETRERVREIIQRVRRES